MTNRGLYRNLTLLCFGWTAAWATAQVVQRSAEAPPAKAVAPTQPAGATADLRFRAVPGTVLRYRLRETKTRYMKDGATIETTLSSEAIMRVTVKSDETGKRTVQAVCEAIKFTAKAGSDELKYDSAVEPATERERLVGTRFDLIQQKTMTITLEPDGMMKHAPTGIPQNVFEAMKEYRFDEKPPDALIASPLGGPVGGYLLGLGSVSNDVTRIIFSPGDQRPERASVGQTWLLTTEGRDPPLCELVELRDGLAIMRAHQGPTDAEKFKASWEYVWDTGRGVLKAETMSDDTGGDREFGNRSTGEGHVELLEMKRISGD